MPDKKKHPDLLGQTFGHFKLQEAILKRDLATLYLADDESEGNPVFLLLLNPTVQQAPELSELFRRRMGTVAQLNHPNVASTIESVGFSANRVYAVMEFFDHERFSERLRRLSSRGEIMPSSKALSLVRQIASALAAAHPVGLIHYDLRPENILIKDENTPILVDLGVPLVVDPDSDEAAEATSTRWE
jgi:serine/threonine protein kinase